MPRTWAALCCVVIGACQIDSREFDALDSAGGDGSGQGLLVQPSSIAYGPITLEFVASARLLVENAGSTRLNAPAVSLPNSGAGAFTLTRNDCTGALEGGAYCEVAVAFRPSDLSAREGVLQIMGAGRRFDIPLSGSGLAPGGLRLQAVGNGSPFGDVPLRGEEEATLQLSNPMATSAGPIELISNNAAFRLLPAREGECESSGARLAAGRSCDFRVRFTPALRGVTDATITARSPGSGSVSLGVSARALAPPRLLVDRSRVDFGDVVVGGTAVLGLAIGNGGDEVLPGLVSSVAGGAESDFQVSANGCSAPLSAGASCSISVSFSPGATGPQGGLLNLDAGSAGFLGVDLSGTGLAASNLLVVAADGRTDFGSVALGSESLRTFRIRNTSEDASGPITLAVNSADFGIQPAAGTECASGTTSLAGGASCDVRVRFAPTQRRQRNATLTVSSMVGGAALNLSGMGLAPAEFRADGAVDFGAVSQGYVTSRDVTVTNVGDEALPGLSTRVSGAHAASFAVQANACRQGLAARESCTLTLAFAPTTTGSQAATLTIEGGAGGTRDVALSGTGTAPALLGVQPSTISFAAPVDVGQSASAALMVINRASTATGPIAASIATATPGFSVAPGTCTAALAGGESCELQVDFAPASPGRYSNSIRVTSTPGGALEVPLSGTANSLARLTLFAKETADFGTVRISTSATRSFTLSNSGLFGAGTLLDIALDDGFSLAPTVGTECSPNVTQLDVGASCDFRVLFQPAATGNFATTLGVSTSLGATTQLMLSGIGASAELGPPTLVGSAPTLRFETVDPTRFAPRPVEWIVRNTGGSATETLVFTNSNTEEFPVVTSSCFGTIAAGGECSVRINFSPNVEGERTAVMTLTAGALSTSVTVIGIGT